jgi:peptidoglycan/LPS O-acetylase OafA/YrhL
MPAGPHYGTATAIAAGCTSSHLDPSGNRSQKFPGLQILRFVAAFSVVLFHLFDNYHTYFGFSQNYFGIGAHGVDVFFVLSGFVITYIADPEKGSLYFMKRRVARIIPLYWLLTFGVALLSIIRPDFLMTTTFNTKSLLLSLAFIPYYKENGLIQPMLFLGWTLNYEVFFYALFALSLLFGRWAAIYTCAVITVLVILGRFLHSDRVIWQFYTNPIMLEFVLGVSLYLIYKNEPELVLKLGCWWVVSLLVILLWVFDEIPILRDVAPPIIAFLLVGAMLGIGFSSWRIVATLVLLGDASYSLYLSHPYIIRTLPKISIAHQNMAFLTVTSVAIVALSIGLSIVLYRIFERPAQMLILRVSTPERKCISGPE